MNHENPWIDATLEGFPENDPKNARRRELLEKASVALPPGWLHPDRPLPAPPDSLKTRRSLWPRLLSPTGLITLALSLVVLWSLILSPTARHRLRGVFLADTAIKAMSDSSFSAPLPAFYSLRDENDSTPAWVESDIALRIHPEHRQLCLGDPTQDTVELRWESLWNSDPENPALFAERVRNTKGCLPDSRVQILKQAEAIEPENDYYELLVVIALAKKAVDHDYLKTSPTTHKRLATIVDPDLFDEACSRLDHFLESKQVESHLNEMMDLRLTGWLPPNDFPDFARDAVWFHSIQPTTQGLPYSTASLGTLFIAQAERISKTGSREEMVHLCDQWRQTLRMLAQPLWGRWSLLAPYQFGSYSYEAMSEACAAHHLPAEEVFFSDFQAVKNSYKSPFASSSNEGRSSSLTRYMPQDYGLDLTPGLLAEHRMFESLYHTWAAIFIIALIGLLSILLMAADSRLLGLPVRLSQLLQPSDYLLIVLTGTVAPALFVTLTLEIPSLHVRDTSFADGHAAGVLLKLCALIVVTTLLTIRQTSRCLSRRAWPLGFAPVASGPLLAMALFALACAPAASFLMRADGIDEDILNWMWIGFFSMLGLVVILLILGICILLYSGQRRIQTSAILRSASPALACAALLISGLVLMNRKIEEHHVAHAHAERIDSAATLASIKGTSPESTKRRTQIFKYLRTAP